MFTHSLLKLPILKICAPAPPTPPPLPNAQCGPHAPSYGRSTQECKWLIQQCTCIGTKIAGRCKGVGRRMLLARAAAARRRWGQCTPTWQQTAERGEKLLNRSDLFNAALTATRVACSWRRYSAGSGVQGLTRWGVRRRPLLLSFKPCRKISAGLRPGGLPISGVVRK